MKRRREETVDICLLYNLPVEVRQYVLEFLSPSSYYIVTQYFSNIFFPKEKRIYAKGDIMTDAVITDNVNLVKQLMYSRVYFNEKINCVAITYESYNILNFTKSLFTLDENIFDIACKNDDILTLQWLKRNNCPVSKYIGSIAAKYGNLDIIKWLHHNDYILESNTWINASKYGYLSILKWAHKNGYEFDKDIIVNTRSAKVLKWLYSIGFKANEMSRIQYGRHILWDIDTMEWLYKNGCSITRNDVLSATDIKSLKWLYENGGKLDGLCYVNAALDDNDEMIELLYENSCPIYEELCDIFAEKGNLKMLKWAKEKGFKLSTVTFSFAPLGNNIEMLEWLYENSCPYNSHPYYWAVLKNNITLLEWFKNKNFPKSRDSCRLAANKGYLMVLIWLLDNEFYYDETVSLEAGRGNNLDVLKYLDQRGIIVYNEKLFKYACEHNNLEMIMWLKSKECPMRKDKCTKIIHINMTEYYEYIRNTLDMSYKYYDDYYTAEKILQIIE